MAGRLASIVLALVVSPATASPTSDLLSDYDGPVLKAPLLTIDDKGNASWKDIKLPYGGGPLLPYACFRQGKVQKITCLVLNLGTGRADFYEQYLREVDT